jgi:hypothetical protein
MRSGHLSTSAARAIFQTKNVGGKIAYIAAFDDDIRHRAVRGP